MITFYDLASTLEGKVLSPNPGKTMMELNYRGIPYKTEYFEYPDIESTCKKIGAPPTGKKADGTDFYTLPVIYDSTTNKAISDSFLISWYREQTYPDTPRLFPNPIVSSQTLSTKAAIALFEQSTTQNLVVPLLPILLPLYNTVLLPRSAAYFRRTREIYFGCKMEEASPPGSQKRADDWKKVRAGLDQIADLYEKSGGDFFFGEVFSRADIFLIAFLLFIEVHADKEDWEAIANANGGRWGRLMEKTRAMQVVKKEA